MKRLKTPYFEDQMTPEKQQETMKFLKGLIREWERLLMANGLTGVAQYGFSRGRKMKLENVLVLIEDLYSMMKETKKEKNKEIAKLTKRLDSLTRTQRNSYQKSYRRPSSSSSDPVSS